MAAFLLLAEYQHQHIGTGRFDPQQISVIIDILLITFPKQQVIDQAAFKNRHDGFEFFPHQKILGTLLPFPVDLPHGFFDNGKQFIPRHGFVQIFQNTKTYGFLRIIKGIIGRDHDENDPVIAPSDLPHGLNAVDPRHMDIHDRYIRPKGFRQFDHVPAASGRFEHDLFSKFLF